jgi:hypothetical protein
MVDSTTGYRQTDVQRDVSRIDRRICRDSMARANRSTDDATFDIANDCRHTDIWRNGCLCGNRIVDVYGCCAMKYGDLTHEQLRRIDAAVAKQLDWRQMYATTIDGIRVPVANEPEYLYPPESEQMWRTDLDDMKLVPSFTTDNAQWHDVESHICRRRLEPEYARHLLRLTGNSLSYTSIGKAICSPLIVRCIAFLMTRGVDADEVIKEK